MIDFSTRTLFAENLFDRALIDLIIVTAETDKDHLLNPVVIFEERFDRLQSDPRGALDWKAVNSCADRREGNRFNPIFDCQLQGMLIAIRQKLIFI